MEEKSDLLIVTAHPDDETLFFGGLLLSRPESSLRVICVTDGNADGLGDQRREEFQHACRRLGAEGIQLDHPDIFEKRLDVSALGQQLANYGAKQVFTHGILGEYGHPHHQDVSYAVHKTFGKTHQVWSVAYNSMPEMKISLRKDQWHTKMEILQDIYWDQTEKFIHLIPCTWEEGFSQMEMKTVQSIYDFLTEASMHQNVDFGELEAMRKYLPKYKKLTRPF